MATNAELLIARYPVIFHVAECGAWESIVRDGLHSTRSLLELFEVDDDRRSALLTGRRTASERLTHPLHGTAYVRDQIPLSTKRLATALTDMTVEEWFELLNDLCFFWPTEKRVRDLLRASHNAERHHDVLVFGTAGLVERHRPAIRLSAINTGATRPFARPRGSDTFLPLEQFPLADRLRRVRRAGAVAEIAVADAVPDASELLLHVERWRGADYEAIVYGH
jgi:hypothetical protein